MFLLITASLSTEDVAFIDELFKLHHLKLYRISFGILRSHSDAEDAVAQSFLKLLAHFEHISVLPKNKLLPYCIVIVKNESANILRNRKKSIPAEDTSPVFSDTVPFDNTVLDRTLLQKALSTLSDSERYFITLHYLHDMSYKQLAALFDITEEAAKKRGQRILARLRHHCGKESLL